MYSTGCLPQKRTLEKSGWVSHENEEFGGRHTLRAKYNTLFPQESHAGPASLLLAISTCPTQYGNTLKTQR